MNEQELLSEALKRTDPAERAAFLDETCAGDSELRRRLVELLAGNAESGGTLDQTPSAPAEFTATADLLTPIARAAQTRPDPDGNLVFVETPHQGIAALAGKYRADPSPTQIREDIYLARDAEPKE
jgi:hypothetical protein